MLLNSFVLCFFSLHSVQAFRALYLANSMGYSHLEYTGSLADALIDAGHEVDYVIQVWDLKMKHNGSQKANIIRFVGKNMDKMEDLNQQMLIRNNSFDAHLTNKDWAIFGKYFAVHCEALLSDHKLLDYFRTRNYTVGLTESFDGCALAVFRMLGIKSVHETSAIPIMETTALSHGMPLDFRHVPLYQNFAQEGPPSSLIEIWYNFYVSLCARFYILGLFNGPTNEVIQRMLGADHPTMSQMQRTQSYVWINSYEFMDFSRLNSPKVKHIGGIAIKKPPPMNKDMKEIFEQAKNGVVLISFGSLVNTEFMRPEMRKQLLEIFASFPDYQFVWRFTELSGDILNDVRNYSNVHAFKWLQQTAILAHPKTVAFVSHIGLNSLNEAVHFGIPLVAVPFFGDQVVNAAMVVRRGNGVFVSKKRMHMMRPALNEILYNKKYHERALDLKAKIANMPIKPEELFVKHVEFAERFDITKDLELDSADYTLIEQFNLDIIGLALLFLALSVFFMYKFLRYLYSVFVLVSRVLNRLDSKKLV